MKWDKANTEQKYSVRKSWSFSNTQKNQRNLDEKYEFNGFKCDKNSIRNPKNGGTKIS